MDWQWWLLTVYLIVAVIVGTVAAVMVSGRGSGLADALAAFGAFGLLWPVWAVMIVWEAAIGALSAVFNLVKG